MKLNLNIHDLEYAISNDGILFTVRVHVFVIDDNLGLKANILHWKQI